MSKEEIQNKIDSISADRDALERTRNKLAGDIALLLRQLAEVEKPKLRHGDFGYRKDGAPRVALSNVCGGKVDRRVGCGSIFSISEFRGEMSVLGNIFDLLKEWSEDLIDFKAICNRHNREFYAQIEDNEITLQTGGDKGEWCWATLAEAEEIWHKLGRVIATLKRRILQE